MRMIMNDTDEHRVQIASTAEQRKSENMYNTGKLYGFKRIRGLLAATIEEGTE